VFNHGMVRQTIHGRTFYEVLALQATGGRRGNPLPGVPDLETDS